MVRKRINQIKRPIRLRQTTSGSSFIDKSLDLLLKLGTTSLNLHVKILSSELSLAIRSSRIVKDSIKSPRWSVFVHCSLLVKVLVNTERKPRIANPYATQYGEEMISKYTNPPPMNSPQMPPIKAPINEKTIAMFRISSFCLFMYVELKCLARGQ
jgi:hypothetical protein